MHRLDDSRSDSSPILFANKEEFPPVHLSKKAFTDNVWSLADVPATGARDSCSDVSTMSFTSEGLIERFNKFESFVKAKLPDRTEQSPLTSTSLDSASCSPSTNMLGRDVPNSVENGSTTGSTPEDWQLLKKKKKKPAKTVTKEFFSI